MIYVIFSIVIWLKLPSDTSDFSAYSVSGHVYSVIPFPHLWKLNPIWEIAI